MGAERKGKVSGCFGGSAGLGRNVRGGRDTRASKLENLISV
jgi:hypothetical protein